MKRAGKPVVNADARRPATNVTWHEATSYCRARNARLPTTYEWEYVAGADLEGQHFGWQPGVPLRIPG